MVEQHDAVNPHFMQQLVSLSETEDVQTLEDVYSANGVKLIGKGTRINHSLYERMISHKLLKPLEASIQIGDPYTSQQSALIAEQLLGASPALSRLINFQQDAKGGGLDPISLIRNAQFSDKAGALLKVQQTGQSDALKHGVLVALLSIGIAQRLRQLDRQRLESLIVAGIFHDIGEMYIDPTVLKVAPRELTAVQWQQLIAHPAIGHKVLKNVGGIAPGVADIVLEHHERSDASGYPRACEDDVLTNEGQILAVAEALASHSIGAPNSDAHAMARAEIAIRFMPGEFRRPLIDLMARCREELQDDNASPPIPSRSFDFHKVTSDVFTRLHKAEDITQQLISISNDLSAKAKKLIGDVMQRLVRLHYALNTTGVNDGIGIDALWQASESGDAVVKIELEMVLHQASERLSNLAHLVTLQSATLPEVEGKHFAPLALVLGAPAE